MASKQQRSKSWGRETENAAIKVLKRWWPDIRRTGSVNYRKAAPDLVADATPIRMTFGQELASPTYPMVVTRDKRQPLIVSMLASDFCDLLEDVGGNDPHGGFPRCGLIVQVKGRERTWLGTLMRELRAATK